MVTRVFKTKSFVGQMKKSGLTDAALCQAIAEMQRGLIDADLGGGVVKKRVALPGRGKSGGARTLLATNRGSRWFFVYGFLKNERAKYFSLGTGSPEAVRHRSAVPARSTAPPADRYRRNHRDTP